MADIKLDLLAGWAFHHNVNDCIWSSSFPSSRVVKAILEDLYLRLFT